ncbi:hypothetical protein EST38_g9807 [Candolleomyces aberdarensis]|uniref:Uncharacterized protein n=1 Tax=Candolleomyces aberdarensis TaxID=2316362 RepID=A0A4Q2D904_9AGAR|nr:hypothetical protein EST38_g9807 [Candolleomyces aberdarensis]
MPLFKSTSQRRNPSPPPPVQTSSGGIFHRNSRTSTDSASSSGSSSRNTRGGGGFIGLTRNRHGLDNDPSIRMARQKVAEAERAEREADAALLAARRAADGAREQVKMLEREAVEEARRAKAKQAEAKVINKSAKGLGRH